MHLRIKWLGVLVVLLLCGGTKAFAQKPEIIHMKEIDAWGLADNDTLYVLNFWATWCRPCVEEMPFFDQIQQEYADRKVKVLFISMDFRNEYDKRLVPFLAKRKFHAKAFLLDEPSYNDWIDRVSRSWSGAIPATLIVQHSRAIRDFHEGDFTYETLKSKIDSLIQQ